MEPSLQGEAALFSFTLLRHFSLFKNQIIDSGAIFPFTDDRAFNSASGALKGEK